MENLNSKILKALNGENKEVNKALVTAFSQVGVESFVKLMEDAIVLLNTLKEHGASDEDAIRLLFKACDKEKANEVMVETVLLCSIHELKKFKSKLFN